MPSIKKNFAYKSALTLSTYIMAFITFPYVSRILGVEKLGLVNYVDNTVSYFLLFASMGINYLGVREIASVRDNKKERDKTFSDLLGMNISFTVIILVIYFVLFLTIPKFNQYSELFFIGAAKILFTAFLIEWFFTGIEDFKYITIRSLIIKIIYVVLVFTLVKTECDYKLYFILTIATVVINALINIIYVRKFVSFDFNCIFKFKKIIQNITLGIYNILGSTYLTFNVMYLGLATDNTQVGYYTTAFKIYSVILGFFSAFTNVMLPRMSSLLANGEKEQFSELINKSFKAMCTFSIPLMLCSIVLAPQLIYVISGNGYQGAIIPMRIIMPAILMVGIAQVLAVQILMPLKKDKILFFASLTGAIVSLAVNITIVYKLGSIGSAIVLLSCETVVTSFYIIFVKYWQKINIDYYLLYHLLGHILL